MCGACMAGIPGWTKGDSSVSVFYLESSTTYAGLAQAFFDEVFTDVSVGDEFIFADDDIGVDKVVYDAEAGTVSVDLNGDGEADGIFTLEGELDGGTLLAVADGNRTVLSFESFLPDLNEGVALAPDAVNGINNQNFLTGREGADFQVEMNSDPSAATLDNALGVYEIDAEGNIVDVRLLVDDVSANSDAIIDITGVEAGHRLGFFLVQDGASWASGLGEADVLSFIDSSGNAGSAEGGLPLYLSVNGVLSDLEVFHSFDQTLNSDGIEHVVSGVDDSGLGIVIGFEDLLGGGDNDYQDAVFSVFEI